MNNLIRLYAVYNRDMNDQLIRCLTEFSEEELERERNMYYKNLKAHFAHMGRGNYGYQMGINLISEGKYCAFVTGLGDPMTILKGPFPQASGLTRRLDEGFLEFSETLEAADLDLRQSRFKMYNGREVDLSLWELVTQHITHQIHHRGQLSQILDELGIEHDFGNVWQYVADAVDP